MCTAHLAGVALLGRRLLLLAAHVLLPWRLQRVRRLRLAPAVALVQLHLGLRLHARAHPAQARDSPRSVQPRMRDDGALTKVALRVTSKPKGRSTR